MAQGGLGEAAVYVGGTADATLVVDGFASLARLHPHQEPMLAGPLFQAFSMILHNIPRIRFKTAPAAADGKEPQIITTCPVLLQVSALK